MSNLRILIVAEHASVRFGGEAALPFHYFRVMRARGIAAWLLCHERIKRELLETFPNEHDRLLFVQDSPLQGALWKFARGKSRFAMATVEAASHMMTQVAQRSLVKRLVREKRIDVVHEPIPVSPVQPSAMFDIGAPVVFGPMNGGLEYPEAFSHYDGVFQRLGFRAARFMSSAVNVALPGKRKAALLIVANERTRHALPASIAHVPTIVLVENGVDMSRFDSSPPRAASSRTRFAFVGRLIDWKGVDMLLEAIAKCAEHSDVALDVYGEGAVRPELEELASRLGIDDRVTFHGFVAQDVLPDRLVTNDALILPSLRECGGAVVLEAMALGKPVIATKWGGPEDYIDDSCGILIEPRDREYMVGALSEAMTRLAESPELCKRLGKNGLKKVREGYDWERKVDRMLELYTQATNGRAYS
jgi:glycosyltransferase involved in cell wall biosynthesis